MSTKKQRRSSSIPTGNPIGTAVDQLHTPEIASDEEDGQRIHDLRVTLGLGEDEFARQCNVTLPTASRWESGLEQPSLQAWRDIAKLAVPPVERATARWFWTKAEKLAGQPALRVFEAYGAAGNKADGQRIYDLRSALGLGQEEFARECKVTRVAALRWENGQARPSSQSWRHMAKLAGQVAPSTALWFWEKAGVDREALLELFPEFEKLSRAAEQRIKDMVAEPTGDLARVPLLRDPAHLGHAFLASPEQVEKWLLMPKELISNAPTTYAIRVSELFVRPIFDPGDIVVIDTAQTDFVKLEGMLAATLYSPSADTKRASESVRRGGPVPASMRGNWPHLPEGLYLGWVRRDAGRGNDPDTISIDSAKPGEPDQLAHSALEFSIPIASFHIQQEIPGSGKLTIDDESNFLGRVICWMSAPKPAQADTAGSASEKKRAHRAKKREVPRN